MTRHQPEPFRFSAETRTAREHDYLELAEQVQKESLFSNVERMMNFPLYAPRQDITRFLCKYEIFKRVLPIHGAIVECGVFFGGGLMTWAHLSAIFEPFNHTRRIIGFDSFEGFPDLGSADEAAESEEAVAGGLSVDSFAEISRCIDLYDMNRPVGHIPRVELVRGDAVSTIPGYVADNAHLLVSLLYLDFDIHPPTKAALEHFVPRMPKGAIIAFDELNLRTWPGETVALLESVDVSTLRLERFAFGSTISFAEIGG